MKGEKIGLRPRPVVPAPVMVVVPPSDSAIAEVQQPLDPSTRMPDLPTIDELVGKMPTVEPVLINGNEHDDPTKATENPETQPALPDKKDNEEEIAALMLASSNVRSSPKARFSFLARKRTKLLRDIDTTLSFLLPDNPETQDEKDHSFAQAYFYKVKEKLEVDDSDTFQKFMETLDEYGNSIFTVFDLYKRVTSVLSKYPEFCEEFIAFLLPEQAMQCGKFMEYLLITKMKDFFCKLEKYFSKQPKQIQNIQTSLTALSTQANVTISDVKSAILPMLKGNAYLTDCFMQLLPQEQIPESLMTDYDEMGCVEVDSENSGDDDHVETFTVPDEADLYGSGTCICLCHNSTKQKYCSRIHHCVPCGVKFIHGKVYIKTGKILRPAKVVFPRENIEDTIRRLAPGPRVRKSRRRGSHQNEVSNSQKHNTSPPKTNQALHGSQSSNSTDNSGLSSRDALKAKPKQRAINTYCRLREMTAPETAPPSSKSASSTLGTLRSSKGATSLKLSAKGQKSGRSTSKGTSVPKTKRVDMKNTVLRKKPSSRSQVHNNKVAASSLKSPGEGAKRRTSSSVSEIVSLPPLERQRVMSELTAHQNQSNVILHDSQMTDVEGNNHLATGTVNANVKPSLTENKLHYELKGQLFNCKTHSGLSESENEKNDYNTDNVCSVENESSVENFPVDKSSQIQNVPSSGVEKMEVDCEEITSEEKDLIKPEEPVAHTAASSVDETDIGGSEDAAEISWTKHEDKVILKMFQQDCSTERILLLIGQQIPQRTVEQIQQRFQTLMSLLQKMTGVNVEDEL